MLFDHRELSRIGYTHWPDKIIFNIRKVLTNIKSDERDLTPKSIKSDALGIFNNLLQEISKEL